jgi:hypothetical protein
MKSTNKVWVFVWNTESGDKGIGPFWTEKPTQNQIDALIVSNRFLSDELSEECLYYTVEEVQSA